MRGVCARRSTLCEYARNTGFRLAKRGKNRQKGQLRCADVAKLVDAPDLGSGAERRGGSSPFIRTT